MTAAPKQVSLFSDNLDSDLRDIVICIPDGGVEKFRSTPTTYDENGNGWVEYDVARKSGKSGLWTVDTYKSFIKDGAVELANKKTAARNLCFFDALYYCGYSEVSRTSRGQAVFDDGVSMPNYKQAAAAASQPLDASGIPQPAAEGHILSDGSFSADQMTLAEKTETVDLLTMTPSQTRALDHDIRKIIANVDVTALPGTIDGIVKKSADIAALNLRKDKAEKVLLQTNAVTKNAYLADGPMDNVRELLSMVWEKPLESVGLFGTLHFMGGGAGFIVGIPFAIAFPEVSIGAFALTGAASSVPLLLWSDTIYEACSERKRKKTYKKLDALTNALPESALKTELREFRLTSEANAHFLKAARHIARNGYKNKRHIKKAFDEVSKGADILGLSDIEKAKLERKFLAQDFPDIEYFEKDLETRMEKVMNAFQKADGSLFRPAADVKALEHKPEMTADDMLGTTVKEKVYEPK